MKYLVCFILYIIPYRLFAFDAITISGKVVSESGEELIGANVSALETSSGTATDANGSYMFDVLKNASQDKLFVKASYIGYQSVIDTVFVNEIIENNAEINFVLPSDVMRLESVVVTGSWYRTGNQKKIRGIDRIC